MACGLRIELGLEGYESEMENEERSVLEQPRYMYLPASLGRSCLLSWMVTTSQQERQRQTSSVAAKPEPGRCRFELQQAASLLVVLLQLKLVISVGLGKQAAPTGADVPWWSL